MLFLIWPFIWYKLQKYYMLINYQPKKKIRQQFLVRQAPKTCCHRTKRQARASLSLGLSRTLQASRARCVRQVRPLSQCACCTHLSHNTHVFYSTHTIHTQYNITFPTWNTTTSFTTAINNHKCSIHHHHNHHNQHNTITTTTTQNRNTNKKRSYNSPRVLDFNLWFWRSRKILNVI